jgi:hypothetical protein
VKRKGEREKGRRKGGERGRKEEVRRAVKEGERKKTKKKNIILTYHIIANQSTANCQGQ